MRRVVRFALDMAARVSQFFKTHPSTEPGFAPILASLEQKLVRADEIAARQHNGLASARSARVRRRELRRELHFQLLPHLIRVGEAAAKDRPELVLRFLLPNSNATYKTFLTAATAMLNLAETHRDLLVSKGLSGALFDDVRRAVAAFEAATEEARVGRIDHIGARADLNVVTGELMEIVRVLDGINRYRYGKDPEATAEWTAAKKLLGRASSRKAPPSSPGPTPPSTGSVAPAA